MSVTYVYYLQSIQFVMERLTSVSPSRNTDFPAFVHNSSLLCSRTRMVSPYFNSY